MPITRIKGENIANSAISTNKVDSVFTATYATYAAVAANLTPRITTVNVANSTYAVLDDTSVNTSGGYLVITGANFQSGALVTIGDTAATSTTYVNDTTLRAQVPAKTAGSYSVYVQNPDGGTAIRVLGVAFSNTPVWGTAAALSNQAANTAFAVSISANSDSAVTYSNTSALPAGTTLLANGLFYGTVTVGSETVFTFDVNAVDAELQDTPRTFSLTVTVGPAPGYMYVMGRGNMGMLGLNDTVNRSSPTQIGSSTWSVVSSGSLMSLAIKNDGSLWSWGYNPNGDLGLNDGVYRSSPTQIGSSTNWSNVVAAYYGAMALKTNGTIWSWGTREHGRLGQNDNVYRSSPTQIGTETTWLKISSGYKNFFATKTDNTLWLWGGNEYGQLGLNDTVHRSSPVQLGSSNWSEFSGGSTEVGAGFTVAIKTDGTLWTWGKNTGFLGLNDNSQPSSPVQIGSSSDWSKVTASGVGFTLALKTNSTLWSWGVNTYGQLGDNTGTNKNSPVQIGSDTNWSILPRYLARTGTAGPRLGAAIKTNGTLWMWGRNSSGELGLNDRVDKSSPTQVGSGTTWLSVTTTYYTTLASRT